MNFDLVFLVILITSFLGMVFLTLRKIPAIVELPNNPNLIPGKELKDSFTKKTKDAITRRRFNTGILLQKTLSKTRVTILRLDNKILVLNQKLKENSKRTRENMDLEIDQIKKKLKEKK
jgi:hypothetical protein